MGTNSLNDPLILEIQNAFRDVPAPPSSSRHSESLEQLALDLPLMTEEVEKWYLPRVMCDSLSHIAVGKFPLTQVEMVIFAFDPEGTFRERNINAKVKLLYDERIRFLTGFNDEQKRAVCNWLDRVSTSPEVKSYFRPFSRIRQRFGATAR